MKLIPVAVGVLVLALPLAQSAAKATVPQSSAPTLPQGELPSTSDDEVAREYFTDLPLVNHEGEQVRFFSDVLKDRVVLINSFYTHCEGITPRQNQVLLRLQEMLGESLGREVLMVSITVDPKRDTPEKVQEYVEGFEARPGWVFLSGKPENVDWVNRKLGQYVEDVEDHKGIYSLGNVGTTLWMKVPAHGQPLDLYRAIQSLLEDQGESADG